MARNKPFFSPLFLSRFAGIYIGSFFPAAHLTVIQQHLLRDRLLDMADILPHSFSPWLSGYHLVSFLVTQHIIHDNFCNQGLTKL